MSRATVSQHLQELKKFDLIKGEIDGQRVCYCINAEKFQQCQQLMDRFFKDIESHLNFDDDTPSETEKYDERCRQMAREMFYAMHHAKSRWVKVLESKK